MNTKLLIVILSTMIPALAVAQGENSTRCTLGELTRRIEIVYETGVTVPCEVHYFKDTEAPGEHRVLWRALNEEGYCEAKAAGLVAKLSDLGWDCGMPAEPVEQTEMEAPQTPEADTEDDETEEPEDDTEALAPVEEIELQD